jgi:hypothetical protein
VTSLGKFQTGGGKGRGGGYSALLEAPVGTEGAVEVPCMVVGDMPGVQVDGVLVGRGKGERNEGVVAVVDKGLVRMNFSGESYLSIWSLIWLERAFW